MNDVKAGRLVRAIRVRHGWRQRDLAARAGVSQQEISILERGHLDSVPLRILRAVFGAIDASAELDVRWRGGLVDRILDERHATLVGETLRRLTAFGWETATEVSYSVYGEHGSIDIVARRGGSPVLLVVEVKSELTSVEQTLRKHDEKVRLGVRVARERLGWEARIVARLLVMPSDRTTRRRVAQAATVLDAAYPLRAAAARSWLQSPSAVPAGLLWLTDTTGSGGSRRVDRVRLGRAAVSTAAGGQAPSGVVSGRPTDRSSG